MKRGYVCDQTGQIKTSWFWATDDPPSPFPDNLTLATGDTIYEDTQTSEEDWDAFQRNLGAYYMIDGVRVAKPEMVVTLDTDTIPADGVTLATVSGIPAGTTATVYGQSKVVNDGSLALTFDLAGDYEVVLSHPHYLSPNPGVIIHAT